MKKLILLGFAAFGLAFASRAESFVNLGTVSGDIVVTDGTRLHAVLNDKGNISIASNATVTLWLAIIQESATKQGAGITCLGDATIILEGENYVCGRSSDFPAIYVPKGSTLTIKGTGKLTAIGNGFAAGIGGGRGKDCGNIVIDGGVITAEGGRSSDNGDIAYITDDMIIPPDSNYRHNTLIIHPPCVNGGGTGIGAGDNATCGRITFKHGIVTAWARSNESHAYPAIGASAVNSSCDGVDFKQTIGKIKAVVGPLRPSDENIVSADEVDYGVVAGVNEGWAGTNKKTVETGYPGEGKGAVDSNYYRTLTVASQLGSLTGHKTVSDEYDVGNNTEWRRTVLRGELSGDYKITIADGTEVVFDGVTVAGGLTSDMPGITCQGSATIILKGENYIKGCGEYSPGIFVPDGGDLSIQGDGSLTVVSGGKYAAAIGGYGLGKEASDSPCGIITVLSGEITAIGGELASALGGFFKGTGDEVVVHGDQVRIYGGSLHARGGVPLWEQDDTILSDGIKWTHSGNEEFFCWNGRLDQVPGYLGDEFPDGDVGGDEIYLTAHTGTVITGNFPPPSRLEIPDGPVIVYDREIRIADGAKVTLRNAFIERPAYGEERSMREGAVFARKRKAGDWYDYSMMATTPRYHAGIRCMGDAEIEIQGDNHIKATEFQAGLSVAKGKKLTLKGEGSLSVYGGNEGGGIDGGSDVIIENGVINAFGGDSGRGIGADRIEFKGGCTTVVAYETKSSDELANFHALGYNSRSEIVVGDSLSRDTEEVSGLNASGYFKNCTEKISFNGNLDGLDDEGENGAKGGGTKKKMMLASAMPKLLGAGDTNLTELDEPDSEAIAGDGTVISGTLSGRHKISIAPDATVTLRNAVIPGTSDSSSPYAGLTCLGNATIILEGDNEVSSFHGNYPGIRVPYGYTLTIDGPGTLRASCTGSGSSFAAGIGGGYEIHSGNIVINGGTITADGGVMAAGIGGGPNAVSGDIEINGGTITAIGGTSGGAGIGSGCDGSCGNITLGAGIAYLRAYGYGPTKIGRGGGNGASGTVSYSLALDKTYDDEGYEVYRWNGNLTKALSDPGDSVALTALDGTTITGSNLSQDVYKKVKVMIAPGAKVTLNAATIDGSPQNLPDSEFLGTVAQWAGITCLGDAEITLVESNKVDTFNCEYPCVYVPPQSTLTIKGSGSLMADNTRAHARGAGTGGGSRVGINNDCGTIIIDGGKVHGYSNGYSTDSGYTDGLGYSAGIGSGPGGWCEGIEIGAGITEVRGCNKAGSGETRPQFSALPIGGGACGGAAYIRPAHGLTDNYIATWADRVFRSIPRVDLSQATGDVTITMDSIVTGRLPVDSEGKGLYKVTIAAGAEVTLKDVTIYGKESGIECEGNASIWLEGMNYVKGANNYPGIYVPKDETLHIYANSADDYLEAVGGSGAAGIGSGDTSQLRASGAIWICGGRVIATGGSYAAGIGSGKSTTTGTKSSCDWIGIEGGAVWATGGTQAAGIGSGFNSTCGDIYIGTNITRVIADRYNSNSAHIGSGYNGTCGTLDIADSLRNVVDGNRRTLEYNPDIDLDPFYIPDTSELLVLDTAVVSGTLRSNVKRPIVIEAGATVTLSNVTITGTNDSNCEWAGITCLGDATIILEGTNNITGYYEDYPGIFVPPHGTLTIKGDGVLNASGSVGSQSQRWAPGIGGGYELDGGNIVIEGGKITATGGKYAAGIGGGSDASFDTIEINGGSVTSLGGLEATGIGSGYGGSCEGVSIGKGILFVSATGDVGGTATVAPIGPSLEGSCARTSIAGGLVQVEDGNTLTIMPAKMNLGKVINDVIVQNGMTLTGTLAVNRKISIAPDARITLKDAVIPGWSENSRYSWAGLTCISNATITLEGTSTVRSYGKTDGHPGIYVPEGSTLTIQGSGSLTAETHTNNWSGAGIGGGGQSGTQNCGNITIAGGRVTACSYHGCVGIGGGVGGRCGTVTIGADIVEVKAMSITEVSDARLIGEGPSWPNAAVVEIDPTLVDSTSYDSQTMTLARTIKSRIVNLATLTEDYIFQDQEVATGTLAANIKLSVASGATVTLRNATISGANDGDFRWAGISCKGNATIILEGENTVVGFYGDYPGIRVFTGKTLTIKGEGSLDVSSNGCGAGIGGGFSSDINCGNIVIEGGTITATAGQWAAAIGGGYQGPCGTITIGADVRLITCTKVTSEAAYVGSGYVSSCGAVSIDPSLDQNETNGTLTISRPWNGDLNTLDSDVTVKDGTIITGTLDGDHVILLEDGATNYLYNATINGKLVCKGNATIVISGDNRIIATNAPAISVPSGYRADIIGNGTLLATGGAAISGVSVDSSLDYETSDYGRTLSVAPKASVVEAAMLEPYTEWATENGIVGAWDARDAKGVANVFRYAFDKGDDEDFTEDDIILGFEADGAGRVAIQTLPVVNGKRVFTFTVVASDNADGTGYVVEYPLSLESDGITYIEEEYNPSRFFRVRVDLGQ